MGSRVVVVGGLEAWLRGETLKECQSDFCHVLHPPSLPPSHLLAMLWVALAARALGALE